MYVSGSVMIVRKEFMLDNPLDENLGWGEGEDVEWSLRVRKFWDYKIFPEMSITSQKQRDQHFIPMGALTRILMKLYSTLIEKVLPKSLSSSLEIGFVDMLSRYSQFQELAERLTVVRSQQANLSIDKKASDFTNL
jgi:hypothetical protein